MATNANSNELRQIVSDAMRDIGRGEAAAVREKLRALPAPLIGEPMVQLQIALACKHLADWSGEMAALQAALTADPYFYPALLQKGTLQERLGQPRAAAKTFRNVLKIMPPADRANPALQRAVAHAENAVRENQRQIERFLDAELAPLRAGRPTQELARFDESVQVMLGHKRAYVSEPVMFLLTRLPSIQFFDDALFPWLPQLEAATDLIRREFLEVIATSQRDFSPYINYPPGAPVNQWAELNGSPRWSSFFLWRNGEPIAANCARCPGTAALLETLPMAQVPDFSPNVMFSCLDPRTHIPPHVGDTNTRLVVHLPLIVPEGCSFRVGNETRAWREGKAWVFDDSIEHEARNDSDALRAILIFDIWNPYLSPDEQALVAKLMKGLASYYDETA